MSDKKQELTAEQLINNLSQFHGTEDKFRHSLNRNLLYTDGVQYLAETVGAYWLIDIVASILPTIGSLDSFIAINLKRVNGNRFVFIADNGNEPDGGVYDEYYKQEIPFSDFPLDFIKLFLCDNTLMLPSEY